MDRAIRIVDKLINVVMVIFFLLLILIGGYALFDSYKIYDDTRLDDEILNLKPSVDKDFNFTALQEINPDVEGWITIFGTTIDYPILHSKDNLDYLNLDYRKEYALGGSVFTDYRNARDFKDDYTIIYGHNMATGQMFSDVKRYEDREYFSKHLYGALYSRDKVYKIEVVYLAKVDAYKDDVYNLITYANGRNLELMSLVAARALGANNVGGYEKLLLLSTCDSYGSNDRTVLLVKLSDAEDEELSEMEEKARKEMEEERNRGVGLEGGWAGFRSLGIWWIFPIIIIIIVIIRRYERESSREHDEFVDIEL